MSFARLISCVLNIQGWQAATPWSYLHRLSRIQLLCLRPSPSHLFAAVLPALPPHSLRCSHSHQATIRICHPGIPLQALLPANLAARRCCSRLPSPLGRCEYARPGVCHQHILHATSFPILRFLSVVFPRVGKRLQVLFWVPVVPMIKLAACSLVTPSACIMMGQLFLSPCTLSQMPPSFLLLLIPPPPLPPPLPLHPLLPLPLLVLRPGAACFARDVS